MPEAKSVETRREGLPAGTASLVARAMPRTAAMVAEVRARLGDAFVDDCVRRGLSGEPGWFFAREGAVAVGTPWGDDADVLAMFTRQLSGGTFLMMRPADSLHDAAAKTTPPPSTAGSLAC